MLKKIITVVAGSILLAACAHSMLNGQLPDYTGPGAATLYIQRPPGGLGALGTIPIALDGAPLGGIGVGEYWKLRVKPGMHNVSDNAGSVGVAMQPGSVHCIVAGMWAMGSYIHPAAHCPPPKDWKMAAHSGG